VLDYRLPYDDEDNDATPRAAPATTDMDTLQPLSTSVSGFSVFDGTHGIRHNRRNAFLTLSRDVNNKVHGSTTTYVLGLKTLNEMMRAFDFTPLLKTETRQLWLQLCKVKMQSRTPAYHTPSEESKEDTMRLPVEYRSVLRTRHNNTAGCEIPALVVCQIRRYNLMFDLADVTRLSPWFYSKSKSEEQRVHEYALRAQTVLILPLDCVHRVAFCSAMALIRRLGLDDTQHVTRLATLSKILAVACNHDNQTLLLPVDTYTLGTTLAFMTAETLYTEVTRAARTNSTFHRRQRRSRRTAQSAFGLHGHNKRTATITKFVLPDLSNTAAVDPVTGQPEPPMDPNEPTAAASKAPNRAQFEHAAKFPCSYPRWRTVCNTLWRLWSEHQHRDN
jgi:hypothetical protein